MNLRHPLCHVCGCSKPAAVEALAHGVTSDCKPSPFVVELFECPDCGVVQIPIDAAWRRRISRIYDAYECYAPSGGLEQKVASSHGLESRSQVLLDWLAATGSVPERGDLLEVGCGLGGFLHAFARKFPFWRSEALEWDARSASDLEKIPGFRTLHTGGVETVPGPFGFFAMVHALEHFENPVSLLASLRTKANPGALLLVQVMDWMENPIDLAVADHATHAGIHRPRRRMGAGLSRRQTRRQGTHPARPRLRSHPAFPRNPAGHFEIPPALARRPGGPCPLAGRFLIVLRPFRNGPRRDMACGIRRGNGSGKVRLGGSHFPPAHPPDPAFRDAGRAPHPKMPGT